MTSEIRFLDIDCIGEVTGQRYVCNFEVKLFLMLKDRAEAGKIRHKTLKDILETDDIYYLLSLLSNLNTHILKKPDWWGEDGTELKDAEPIIALATELRAAQQADVNAKKPKEKEDKKK